MTIKFKKIGIFTRPELDEEGQRICSNLVEWLIRRKATPYLSETTIKKIPKLKNGLQEKVLIGETHQLLKDSNLIISLGGDGTLISTARNLKNSSIPILGVNLGNLGFTTEFSKSELFDELELILKNKFDYYKLSLFSATVFDRFKKIQKSFFVNDAVVGRKDVARLIELSIQTQGQNIYDLRGDGLIISSPIGSTAYSLAAGGPIIHPNSKSMVITPISPHSLNHRPIVIPENFELKIKPINTFQNLQLTLDGQEAIELNMDRYVLIKKSSKTPVKIITNPGKNYFLTLKNKFTLGRS